MSARLDNETYEQFKNRQREEQFADRAKLQGTFTPSQAKGLSRTQRRNIDKSIPHDDLIVLAKVAETAGNEMPLVALKLLYNQKTKAQKREMIKQFISIINEPITETIEE